MSELAFNKELYLKIQREKINERINLFGDKLYLEFGGKLFDDKHASRVLPGFDEDLKLQMLLGLKDKAEIVFAVNASDIDENKIRGDIGISYSDDVKRLIDAYLNVGLYVSSVVISFYNGSKRVKEFEKVLKKNGIKVYKHYEIKGYPQDLKVVCSDQGLGKNEYVETTRPLIVVTAPGPGSGKMATCLSQLYHDYKKGIKSGYAKYETFPVWNLPLKHPVNLAYEAATVDLEDTNMIDPYHFEKYGVLATNYNRDVEAFPILKSIFETIYGKSPYFSPTDMGVNAIGFAITNDDIAVQASKDEIIRRYYQTTKKVFMGQLDESCITKCELLMSELGITVNDRKCVKYALEKAKKENVPCKAMIMPDGHVITGKRSKYMSSSAGLILNAIKYLAGIDDDILLISPKFIQSSLELKENSLHYHNAVLHLGEALLALSIQKPTDGLAKRALAQIPKLKGLQVHSSMIGDEQDIEVFKRLGIDVTEEPISYAKKIYLRSE